MNKLPNIIFLDFDGVICNPETCIAEGEKGGFSYLDPISTRLIKRLCEENNARIVISSSWRKLFNQESIRAILSASCPSLGNYMYSDERWKTKSLTTNRGREIEQWIKDYSATFENFVIIDDDNDMEPLMDNFVRTDSYQGFRLRDFIKAKEILKGEGW